MKKETYMNKQEKDVLNSIYHNLISNQRELAKLSGHSLGVVNKAVKQLQEEGYIDAQIR